MKTHDQMTGIRISMQDGVYDAVLREGGVFEMASQGAACACALQTRLMQYRSELVNHPLIAITRRTSAGVDYYGVVFDTSRSPAERTMELRRVVLGTPGVLSILSWSESQVGHTLTITFAVQTQWGAQSVSQELQPL
jgi:hypothetical protein